MSTIVNNSETAPILLLNEADSIIKETELSMDTILQYCRDEILNSFNSSNKIGFESDTYK